MASGADAAKNLFDSVFSKTKEVVAQATESTKGFASQAFENVQKIIPGQQNPSAAVVDPQIMFTGSEPGISGRSTTDNCTLGPHTTPVISGH